jgi:hypothetical protein
MTVLNHHVAEVESSFFCGLECVGHSFAYVAHFVFFKDVWIRTQKCKVVYKMFSFDFRAFTLL